MKPVLDQAYGYGIVLGFGAFFAIVMTSITMAQKRYHNEFQSSEMYMTAHRSVKTGLVASAVVSSWTWAATLLQSSTVAYKYGVSGPFWYASGATIQVLLFAILAIELKRKAPNAHTMLEIVNVRYGRPAHITFLFFGLATNSMYLAPLSSPSYCSFLTNPEIFLRPVVVTAMLLLGGSAVVNTLTGMDTIAACFLLPLGVIVYTLFGGLKATFLTDYVHTTVIFIIILSFVFTVYGSSNAIGSPMKMYDLLVTASKAHPVPDNAEGSYLTMDSLQGLIFGIINIVGNFGTVFVDNAYWQRAIAARPSSTVKAYLVGGLAWFAIPFTLATTMGIAGVALESDMSFPSYPERLSPDDVSAGLVVPAAAVALLGSSGAIAVLVLVFMAVTSAASAELIAVSSIFTYDIYRTYIKPGALGKEVIKYAHFSVIGFGILMGVLAVILRAIGIDLGYMYLLMGIISSPAVVPIAYTLTWSKQSGAAAIFASLFGLVSGIAVWLGVAKSLTGEITLASTGGNYPMLAGNLVALLGSGLVTTIWSLVLPENFDFNITKTRLQQLNDDEAEGGNVVYQDPIDHDEGLLKKASRFAFMSSVVLTIVLVIIWPLPMFFSHYVFSKEFFTFWVAVSMIWAICSTVAVAIYPIVESRESIVEVLSGIIWDLTGKRIVKPPTPAAEKTPGLVEAVDIQETKF
ncbi:Sodium:solute symporter family-domain-containing protein [Jimgerdemannia flammicorona]|uniref:Sodium:solute symporter family-domain-containing protein n=1 Tax=Jimgerdemannia flammicorona TaxID=994334 RepID=A0A433DA65_9FUNG|nr:Sodium:solute symporter family-domain-containing protein [Jimgerdemannia flammicorona]